MTLRGAMASTMRRSAGCWLIRSPRDGAKSGRAAISASAPNETRASIARANFFRLNSGMRGGAVIVLLGLTALISYSIGRRDAPTVWPTSPAAVPTTKPIAVVDAPLDAAAVRPQPAPSQSPTPNAKAGEPSAAPSHPDAKRKAEVALTAAAIAAIIVKASRDQYYATGHPCACPDDLMRTGRACGGRSAYSRPGGAAPLCYPTDVTPEMIELYRRRVSRQ